MDEVHAVTTVLRIEEGVFGYNGGKPVLDVVSLALEQGERVALLGGNGAGKTTFLHVLMGLLPLRSGSLDLFGVSCSEEKAFRAARRRMGLLFQDADDQLFCPTVAEDVAFGPLNLGLDRAEALARVQRSLEMLGISGFDDRVTYELSSGEKRLVALAGVLAMEPEILLLDEPTNGLDAAGRARVEEQLLQPGRTSLIVSHDEVFLDRVATRRVSLRGGQIVMVG
jgi:cobalt/nickel transport system ATP-binding protein